MSELSAVPDTPPVLEFRITFGQKYRREHHPALLAGLIDFEVHPDGWVTVEAPDEVIARRMVYSLLGSAWCDIYEMADADTEGRTWDWSLWPLGELASAADVRSLLARQALTS